MRKKSLEQEINEFLELWSRDDILNFLRDICDLYDLYDVKGGDEDWVANVLSTTDDDAKMVRLIRTVYLLSRISSKYAGKLVRTNAAHRELWLRMEEKSIEATQVNYADGKT